MAISRREFLWTVGSGCVLAGLSCRRDQEAPRTGSSEQDLAELAIRTLKARGVEYADIRVCRYRFQEVYAEDYSFKRLVDSEHSGFGIRALVNGAWGFAASQVLDEPTVGQDGRFLEATARFLTSLKERGFTILLVTHDLEFASAVAERWIFLEEGAVIGDGCPEDLMKNDYLISKGFFEEMTAPSVPGC